MRLIYRGCKTIRRGTLRNSVPGDGLPFSWSDLAAESKPRTSHGKGRYLSRDLRSSALGILNVSVVWSDEKDVKRYLGAEEPGFWQVRMILEHNQVRYSHQKHP